MKFKGQVYRDAIKLLPEQKYSCLALKKISEVYNSRYSRLFVEREVTWVFSRYPKNCILQSRDKDYDTYTELGRRTREIALELAGHLEDIGEMDRILKGEL